MEPSAPRLDYAPPPPPAPSRAGVRLLKAMLALLLLLVAAVCAFGFLASFEYSGAVGLRWKLGYAGTCVACLLASGALAAGAFRRRRAGRGK